MWLRVLEVEVELGFTASQEGIELGGGGYEGM